MIIYKIGKFRNFYFSYFPFRKIKEDVSVSIPEIKETQARKRLNSLFDEQEFTEIDAFALSEGESVEVVAGFGTVNGNALYAFSQDITSNGGAISKAQCEKIKKVYSLAAKTGCPVVGIYDSNGMKLKEGFEALGAYGEVLKASASISGVVPQISIISGACLGTSAIVASAADIVVAVDGSDFYLCVPSEATVEQSGKNGSVDIVAEDFDKAVSEVRNIVSLLPSNNLAPLPMYDFSSNEAFLSSSCDELKSDTMALINAIADTNTAVELKSDFAKGVKTVLASVMGSAVGFVGFTGKEICPNQCQKVTSFVKLCDAYSVPVITLVNTPGFVKGEKAEEAALVKYATELTSAYATATTQKISLVTGQAVGAAYIALAGRGSNSDLTFAWDCAQISPLDADAAVSFMYNDRLANGETREELKAEYIENEASPYKAAACSQLDDVFKPEQTRARIIKALDMLSGKRETTLPRKHSVK